MRNCFANWKANGRYLRPRFAGRLLAMLVVLLAQGAGAQTVEQLVKGSALLDPEDVVVDNASGNVFVAARSGLIFKIDTLGIVTEYVQTRLWTPEDSSTPVKTSNLAIASDSSLYITDSIRGLVFRVTPTGDLSQVMTEAGDGMGNPLITPTGMAIDLNGNLFVAGQDSNNVFRLGTDGVVTEIINETGDGSGNQLLGPQAVAVDNDGNVYVTGSDSNNAFRVGPNGSITRLIDADGDGLGNVLSEPWGIGVDAGGNVFVSGRNSDNVFRVEPGGNITEILDSTGAGVGKSADQLHDLTVDADGNVFVAGRLSNNAFKIASEGTITELINLAGDGGSNDLIGAAGVAVDTAGNVLVVGATSNNVFKIAPDSTIMAIADVSGASTNFFLGWPRAIAAGAGGSVFLAGQVSDNVLEIKPDGSVTQVIGPGGDNAGETLDAPVALAIDPTGNLLVGGQNSNNVFRVTPEGLVDVMLNANGDGAGATLGQPYALATDADGNVFVAGFSSDNVFRIHPTEGVMKIADDSGDGPAGSLTRPNALAVDAFGNVYVAGGTSDNAFRITPTGQIARLIDDTHGLNAPTAIAVDSTGGVYVAMNFNRDDQIFHIATDSAITTLVDLSEPGHLLGASPTATVVDKSDNLYFALHTTSQVFQRTPGGLLAELIGPDGDGLGSFMMGPVSLAVDSTGNVYTAGSLSHNAFRINTRGAIACTPAVDETCIAAGQAKFHYSERRVGGERMKVQWKELALETTQATFGDPVNGKATAAICIYDDSGSLVRRLASPAAGETCAGYPCWKERGSVGFGYRDKVSSSDGLTKMAFTAGDVGRGAVSAKAGNKASKGQSDLPVGVTASLEGNMMPTVQFRASGGLCVSAQLNKVTRNDSTQFKAQFKSP